MEYPKIPKGQTYTFTWESEIYPNTVREYVVYVPEQYSDQVPASVLIFQDGHTYLKKDGDFRTTTVLDNLIAQEKIPVTIAIFINPGHHKDSTLLTNPWKASNRSVEYDSMDDKYGQFLIEEILPEVSKTYTISHKPEETAIVGISSGGIAAFTAAWHHPERFQKVISHIGSFTNIKGGHVYPSLIRKSENKNIKVFLQGNENDLDNEHGNWYLANQQMAAALAFKNYDYQFVSGSGGHNGKMGGEILPQALEWIWKDRTPNYIPGKAYSPPTIAGQHHIVSGHTIHFDQMELSYNKMEDLNTKSKDLSNEEYEQIIIIQQGQFKITLKNTSQTIGPNSVAVILPGEEAHLSALSEVSAYYTMKYKSRQDEKFEPEQRESFVIDYPDIPYKSHSKGGVRSYFNTSTTMCPYYEMHITTLNPGIKSHEPHTHKAAEILLMIEGETEEEIGNNKFSAKTGDFYYIPANVPHAIKNTGNKPCQYFAFQWY
ncbi:hypothetical protein GCM10025777_19120 [Membranihabitans marinus]